MSALSNELYMLLGYGTIFLIATLIILYNIINVKNVFHNCKCCCRCCRKKKTKIYQLPENGRLIDADNLKQHFNIRLDRDAFSKENKLVNKLIRQRSISIEENEATKISSVDETDCVDDADSSPLPSKSLSTENAEYTHHNIDQPLNVEMMSESPPHLFIQFKKLADHFGVRAQKSCVPEYNIDMEEYSITEHSTTTTHLLPTHILTITSKKTGNELKLKSVTVLQRGETQLPDYYSMLLIQRELSQISNETGCHKLHIAIHSSETRYIAAVTVMECLNQVIRQKAINPIKVINGLIEQYPSYELAQDDHIWIYETLVRCHESPICRDTLESFATAHPSYYLQKYHFCTMILNKLKSYVPPLDMKLCIAGAQLENRSRNRSVGILPMDGERPYFDHFTPPLESKYFNATFIKGHLSEHQFIATEWPQTQTITPFWRLVSNHRINNIFVIGEAGQVSKFSNYPQFWPSDEPISDKMDKLTVCCVKCEGNEYDVATKYSMLIKEQRFTPVREVVEYPCQLYNIKSWPCKVFEEDCTELTKTLVEILTKANDERSEHCASKSMAESICVVSRDGAAKCGVILALWDILEQLYQPAHTFDLFNTMRLIKLNRPQLLNNVDEIALIHELLFLMKETSPSRKVEV